MDARNGKQPWNSRSGNKLTFGTERYWSAVVRLFSILRMLLFLCLLSPFQDSSDCIDFLFFPSFVLHFRHIPWSARCVFNSFFPFRFRSSSVFQALSPVPSQHWQMANNGVLNVGVHLYSFAVA